MDGVVVRLAGSLAVVCGDVRRAGDEIGSRKARRLLTLLAARRSHLGSISEIIQVLWTGQPPQRPADNVATLVSRLHTGLTPAVVVGGRRVTAVGSTNCSCDDENHKQMGLSAMQHGALVV
jgi:hypothetical protein